MHKKIQWEKWKDPFAEMHIEDEDGEHTEYQSMKMLHTNFGIMPLPEYSNPAKVFNLWVGNTNFNVSLPILKVIEETDGVEVLTVFSRYRFRIGIGALFDEEKVKKDIERQICVVDEPISNVNNVLYGHTPCKEMQKKIDEYKKQLNKHQHWILYGLPNGEFEMIVSEEIDSAFEYKLEFFNALLQVVGGVLYTSEDNKNE